MSSALQNSGRTVWTSEELAAFATTDDLHISPFREDGKTYGTPTWIWSVVVDGALYARGANGQESRWYNAAKTQKAGRIRAAGFVRKVRFELVEDLDHNDRIDYAYRTKYRGSPYVAPMIGPRARGATVRIVPA